MDSERRNGRTLSAKRPDLYGFPNETIFEIYPNGYIPFSDLRLKNPCRFFDDVKRDTSNRNTFIGDETSTPILNIDWQDQIIGESLKNNIGATYREAISVLMMVIEGCEPAPEGLPIPFVHKSKLIDIVSQKSRLSKETIEIILKGFTLSKTNMESEGREIWKPKQEYRAFRRAFFEMPHEYGTHLTFSKEMAIESWAHLTLNVVFKQFPSEWKSRSVNANLNSLSRKAGSWFEEKVAKNLAAIGFKGLRGVKKIKFEGKKIFAPENVGEIDYLGYSEKEKILIVAECKMVQGGFEGKYFRDDLVDFVNSKKSYAAKFSRKIDWVLKNKEKIIKSIKETNAYSTSVEPESFASIIITLYPNISGYKIEEYPCVSLTNFMLDYQISGRWPYAKKGF